MPKANVSTPYGNFVVELPEGMSDEKAFEFVQQLTAPYGLRTDNTPKGAGYFGPIARPDGNVSTELSFDFDANGQKILAPLLVPTLTRQEIDLLMNDQEPTPEIWRKAQEHAMQRLRAGKPVFAEPGELHPLPEQPHQQQQTQP